MIEDLESIETRAEIDLGSRRALVMIPAYNESAAIARTIRDVRRHASWADILVVNDGSADDTSEQAARAGAKVVDLPVNLGIGGAVQTGYRYAWINGYDMAFQFDGDGQHRARRLADLVRPLLKEDLDLVVGSRFLRPRGMTATGMRLAGIAILSRAISAAIGQRITDPTSGVRGAGRRAIELFAAEYPQDYPEPESLVLLYKQGFRIKEVPATMRRRRGGVSSIGSLKGIHYMVKVLLAVAVDMVKAPVRLEGEVA